jgi:YVTN family beta-propeller protein
MMIRPILLASLFLVFISGCVPQGVPSGLRPAGEGEIYLYLEPFPREADRLRFSLRSIVAVREDGAEFPLTPKVTDFVPGTMTRERLFAVGSLPPGDYRGLAFEAGKATLATGEGDASLLVTGASRTDFPFRIAKGEAAVLKLSFRPRESVGDGFNFTPVFSALRPTSPGIGLIGYVSNRGSDTITVFDKQSLRVTGMIATGRAPSGIAFDRRNRTAYVALAGDDAVEVIDLTTSAVIRRIHLHAGDSPTEVVVARDGRLLVSVNTGSSSMSFIDTVTGNETGRIRLGNGPGFALSDAAGKRVYVLNTLADTLSVADLDLQREAGTVSTEPAPAQLAFNRRGDLLYVACAASPYLAAFDPASLSLRGKFYVGTGLEGLRSDPATGLVYGARSRFGTVEIYEPSTFVALETIRTGGTPTRMTIDTEENNLLILDPEGKRLIGVNLVSRKTVGELDLGEAPHSVAVAGER